MHKKKDRARASVVSKDLRWHKDDFISRIIALIDEIYLPVAACQGDIADRKRLLRSGLVDLINDSLEKEGATETREVTIMLSDLRGFTSMSENYPATSIIEGLNRYFSTMSEIIITQYGGTIDKFMGDSIMVIFGMPENRKDDLERALSCAVRMQLAMDEINRQNRATGMPPLYMGIGINTGRVVAGKVGSKLHSEYTIIGDEVNLASRIESFSLRGQILISENTYKHAKDYIETDKANQVLFKGKQDPVNLYELLAVKQPVPLSVPRVERRKSPRIDVNMPFMYQVIAGKNILPEIYSGRILNIGYNGVLASLAGRLEVYTEIKFTLSLSDSGEKPGDIYAKILRIEEVNGLDVANIEFTSIHIRTKKVIKSFVDRIIQGI